MLTSRLPEPVRRWRPFAGAPPRVSAMPPSRPPEGIAARAPRGRLRPGRVWIGAPHGTAAAGPAEPLVCYGALAEAPDAPLGWVEPAAPPLGAVEAAPAPIALAESC